MPRGDGTGPMGNGPIGRRRQGNCRQTGMGFNFSLNNNNRQDEFSFGNRMPESPESLEAQAERLEAQATNLRNLAKQSQRS